MLPLFVGGLLILVGVILFARWALYAPPAQLVRLLRLAGIAIVLLVAGFLAFTGRLGQGLAALFFLWPMLMRWRGLMNRMRASRGPRPNQQSTVSTRYFEMSLDHDTGTLAGTVRSGAYRNRQLDDLDEAALAAIAREIQDDPQSVSVFETYLDRRLGPDWRERFDSGGGGAGGGEAGRGRGAMSREEAWLILGLEPGAKPEEIRAAHRRLMKRHHPDAGGSADLAARINEAKDLLLNGKA